MEYPIVMTPDDNGTLLVTCPDLPEVTTFGEDEEDAQQRAIDAIEEALAARIAHRKEIPAGSPARNAVTVALPPLTSAKVELYLAAMEQGVTKATLRRELGLHGPQVDRLFNVRHSSKIEEIDRALHTMGKRLEITAAPITIYSEARPATATRTTASRATHRTARAATTSSRRAASASRRKPEHHGSQ